LHNIIKEDLASIVNAELDWFRFQEKTILITGGAGFLASHMVETLLFLNDTIHLKCRILCLIRSKQKARKRFAHHSSRADLVFIEGDVADSFDVHHPCDFIIHAASHASPRFYSVDPVGVMAANIKGTSRLLDLALEWKTEGLLLFSSGEVYGQLTPEKVPTRETDYGYIDILNSRSCYAESKRAAETLAVCHSTQFGTHNVIVRPFHTYGPGISFDDGRVFSDFVRDVVYKQNITIHGNGSAVRAFCYTSDAISGFFTALLKGENAHAYNIGNPNGTISIGELADLIAGLFPERGISVDRLAKPTAGYLKSPIQINSPDIGKIAKLGWNPCVTPTEGFSRTIRFYTE
jgi:UDP-glucuronate decarboxylase